MKKVTIAGKEFPIAFSFKALDEICESKNISFAEMQEAFSIENIRPFDVVLLAFEGMKEGARREKRKFSLTMDDVDDLLMEDTPAISRIMAVFAHQNSAPEKNPEAPHRGATKQGTKKPKS